MKLGGALNLREIGQEEKHDKNILCVKKFLKKNETIVIVIIYGKFSTQCLAYSESIIIIQTYFTADVTEFGKLACSGLYSC